MVGGPYAQKMESDRRNKCGNEVEFMVAVKLLLVTWSPLYCSIISAVKVWEDKQGTASFFFTMCSQLNEALLLAVFMKAALASLHFSLWH